MDKNGFWRRVNKAGPGHPYEPSDGRCWMWEGAVKAGYGRVETDGRSVPAHRFSWELAGHRIEPGLVLRHTCDRRRCVNPAHLLPGTKQDNTNDMVRRGRQVKGSNLPQSRLCATKIREARRLRRSGRTVALLARMFGVSLSAMSVALRGITWSQVENKVRTIRSVPPRRPIAASVRLGVARVASAAGSVPTATTEGA